MNKFTLSFKSKVFIPIITIFVLSVFVITMNNYILFDNSVKTKANSILNKFTENILMQINHLEIIQKITIETLNEQNMATTRAVANILDQGGVDMSTKALQQLAQPLGIIELCIADREGTIIYSNYDEYLGFNFGSTEFTKKYMELADGTINELIEEPRKSVVTAPNVGDLSLYTGISRKNGGFIQIGYDVEVLKRLQDEINIEKTIKETSVGENGFGIIVHNEILIAHKDDALLRNSVNDETWYKAVNTGDGFAWITIDNVKYYSQYKNENDHTVIGLIPETEYYQEIKQVLFDTAFFASIAFIFMIVVLYTIMGKLLNPIKTVTESLGEIAKGNFDARVKGNYSGEFALIKNAVNDMAVSITTHLNDKLKAERLVHEAELTKLELLVKVYYDGLTGVYNRRYLDENLELIIKTLSRSNGTLSMIMADIDCFKQYNDTYGHSEGDECLKIIAKVLKDSITREGDFVGRYGGEEFYVILPNTEENGAKQIADKILNSIRELKINNENSKAKPYITISLGIASGNVNHMQKSDCYIKRADEALYVSKQNGRDKYTFLPIG